MSYPLSQVDPFAPDDRDVREHRHDHPTAAPPGRGMPRATERHDAHRHPATLAATPPVVVAEFSLLRASLALRLGGAVFVSALIWLAVVLVLAVPA